MDAENPYMQWVEASLGLALPTHMTIAHDRLDPLGGGASNHPTALRTMRAIGRGGILDKHLGETGLAVLMAPLNPDRDLLRLAATTRSDPRVIAIGVNMIEVRPAPAPAFASDFLLRGVMQWGTGKGFSQALFDLRQGAQLSIAANIINLAVRYVGTVGPIVRVSASAAYGLPQSGAAALTFTELPAALAGNATGAAFRIPAWATRVQWYSPNDPVAAPIPGAIITQHSDTDPTGRIIMASAPASNSFVEIANGADFIRLTNTSGAGHDYGLLYELHI